MKNKFDIVIVSPVDVKFEREIVESVCKELNPYLKNITLKSNKYEDFPGDFNYDAQESFENYFDIKDANLVVAIFWKRIGTQLPEKYRGAIFNTKVTGSQYELEKTMYYKKPLWIYIKQDKRYDEDVADDIFEDKEQYIKLKEYLNQLNVGLGNTFAHHYFYKKEFKTMFKSHLIAEIKRVYGIELEIEDNREFTTVTNTKKSEIDQNYYAGLYGFFVISAVILLFYNNNYVQSPKISLINYLFAWSLIFLNIPAVKSLSLDGVQNSSSFKEVFLALLRRAGFMIFFAILLTIFLYLVVNSLGFSHL